ncbi:S-adenosylmethionine-dependent methyltransferase [Saccharomycopsis crataegensis]|uniref:Protein N-terminal and lysine N-methyltransferase EFM7 n=1 Tax=Saccharomycopsis crataegensis TaxID=43959 RepID=A0AAV5QG72_9ASCO|nr:S-adenosylmethionine-dependent methyltransferase [Saccharomycopsis crataegensis]
MSDEQDDFISSALFDEPEDFRPPPPESHFVNYDRFTTDLRNGTSSTTPTKEVTPKSITLRLIGSSPLWGHLLWNAGRFTAQYLDSHPELIKGKKILELGAAGGLPSLICSLNEPKKVISTDYPDLDLVNNIKINFQTLQEQHPGCYDLNNVLVQGYIWGNDYGDLVKFIKDDGGDATSDVNDDKFDLIILSDLVFNHTEHHKLLKTCRDLVNPKTGKCLVVFSPHRPWLLNDDLEFFDKAQEDPYNFKVDKIDLVNWKPMFEEDEETKHIRGRVYSFWLTPNW